MPKAPKSKKKPPSSHTYPYWVGGGTLGKRLRELHQRGGEWIVGIDVGEVNLGVCARRIDKDATQRTLLLGVVNLRASPHDVRKTRTLKRYEVVHALRYMICSHWQLSPLFLHASHVIVETQGYFDHLRNAVIETALYALLEKAIGMPAAESKKYMPDVFVKPPEGLSKSQANAHNKRCVESMPDKLPFTPEEHAMLEKIPKERRHHALDARLMAHCAERISKDYENNFVYE